MPYCDLRWYSCAPCGHVYDFETASLGSRMHSLATCRSNKPGEGWLICSGHSECQGIIIV